MTDALLILAILVLMPTITVGLTFSFRFEPLLSLCVALAVCAVIAGLRMLAVGF